MSPTATSVLHPQPPIVAPTPPSACNSRSPSYRRSHTCAVPFTLLRGRRERFIHRPRNPLRRFVEMSAGLIEDGPPTHRTKAPEKANKTHIGNRTVEWRPALGRRGTPVHKKGPVPMFARSTTYLVVTLVALVVTAPVSAQRLPGWAEPSGGSEPRESRFHERKVQRERPESELSRSRERPLGPEYQTDPLGPQTDFVPGCSDFFGLNVCDNLCDRFPESCQASCEDTPNAPRCRNSCDGDGNDPDFCADVVPVDDYLPLLALAGIAFAALRLRQ
jgi:hypothetical protein